MARTMLTTRDNPFDPFTEFTDWYAYDEAAGWHSSGYLARIVMTSDELSDRDQEEATELAIDEIIALHPSGPYVKVYEKTKIKTE